MKWSPVLLLIITLLTLLAGCELGTHTYYFYSWAVDDEEPAYELTYRKDGYTIIMSRGRGGFDLDKGEAEGLIGYTEFTLKLNDEELEPIDEKSVAKLDNGWHVVQHSRRARSLGERIRWKGRRYSPEKMKEHE